MNNTSLKDLQCKRNFDNSSQQDNSDGEGLKEKRKLVQTNFDSKRMKTLQKISSGGITFF